MRSITEELEKLKTSMFGYEKEATQVLIRELLQEYDDEKQKELEKLWKEKQVLQLELSRSKESQSLLQSQFDNLFEKMEKMSEAMEKNAEYTKSQDQKLEAFYKKETEIKTLHEKATEEAKAEKEQLLSGVTEEKKRLIHSGETEKDRLVREGEELKQQLIEEGKEQKQRLEKEAQSLEQSLKERTEFMRKMVNSFKEQFLPVFTWSDIYFPETGSEKEGLLGKEQEEPLDMEEPVSEEGNIQ